LPIIPDAGWLDIAMQNESNLAHETIRYCSTRAATTTSTEATRARAANTTAKASRIA
jgi:hypothetical protein